MSIFPIFKTKPFFNDAEKLRMVDAIRQAELNTSGEMRVYVESKNPYVNPIMRAKEVFYDLRMDKTADSNAVLLYIAMKHKEIALFADEGIYTLCGKEYWNNTVKTLIKNFEKSDMVLGIEECIHHVGEALKEKFPHQAAHDKNELPDEIVFGK